MRICSKCKIEKTLTDFYFDKRPGRGYKSICKDCENIQKRMKRKIDWKLENQHISVFISAFKKRFGNHKNFTQEFIEAYIQNIKLQSVIRNKKDNCYILHNNLVCNSCGQVQPLELPLSMERFSKISELFQELHKRC
jgi:Fe2+ or Zn2+ uptake regulation protein